MKAPSTIFNKFDRFGYMNEKLQDDVNIELKSLNSKIMTLSGYMIAMRYDSTRDFKTVIKHTYHIRGCLYVCLITTWFLVALKAFS